jgi:hypothetical protein
MWIIKVFAKQIVRGRSTRIIDAFAKQAQACVALG